MQLFGTPTPWHECLFLVVTSKIKKKYYAINVSGILNTTRTRQASETVTPYSATPITDTDSIRVTHRMSSLRPFAVMHSLAR